jgi:hypothetical protein
VGVFPSQDLAFHVKGLVEQKIEEGLANLRKQNMPKMRKAPQKAAAEETEPDPRPKVRKLLVPDGVPMGVMRMRRCAQETVPEKIQPDPLPKVRKTWAPDFSIKKVSGMYGRA